MLIFGLHSLIFILFIAMKNRLKVNITPYGDFFYYLIYTYIVSLAFYRHIVSTASRIMNRILNSPSFSHSIIMKHALNR